MRTLLLLTLCCSTGALAIAKGGTLYIRAKDVALLKEPKVGAPTLMKLQVGTEVVWLGPSAKDKVFHEVQVAGKKGFVLLSSLSPSKPQEEVDSATGRPMSAAAFASSGAVIVCTFGPTSRSYQAPAEQTAAAELIYVEQLNKAKATPEAIAAKEKELRGP